MTVYVVATTQKEAEELAEEYGHYTRRFAEKHLGEVKAPPTDPFYGSQYKIFEVEIARGTPD